MKAVIDEDLHRSLQDVLTQLRFEVYDIRDHGLRGKTDKEIYNFAQDHEAVLFTGDLDFASILRFPPGTHHGICVLRFPNQMMISEINSYVRNHLDTLNTDDYLGSLIILTPLKIRIRRSAMA